MAKHELTVMMFTFLRNFQNHRRQQENYTREFDGLVELELAWDGNREKLKKMEAYAKRLF